jgi:VanZ family protein
MLYLVPALAHAGLIFFLSAQPDLRMGVGLPAHADKAAHAGVFALLALLAAWGLARSFPAWERVRVLLLSLLVAVIYGALDELHQRFVPGRTPDPMDLVADAAGALLVITVLGWLGRRAAARVPERAP